MLWKKILLKPHLSKTQFGWACTSTEYPYRVFYGITPKQAYMKWCWGVGENKWL